MGAQTDTILCFYSVNVDKYPSGTVLQVKACKRNTKREVSFPLRETCRNIWLTYFEVAHSGYACFGLT